MASNAPSTPSATLPGARQSTPTVDITDTANLTSRTQPRLSETWLSEEMTKELAVLSPQNRLAKYRDLDVGTVATITDIISDAGRSMDELAISTRTHPLTITPFHGNGALPAGIFVKSSS